MKALFLLIFVVAVCVQCKIYEDFTICTTDCSEICPHDPELFCNCTMACEQPEVPCQLSEYVIYVLSIDNVIQHDDFMERTGDAILRHMTGNRWFAAMSDKDRSKIERALFLMSSTESFKMFDMWVGKGYGPGILVAVHDGCAFLSVHYEFDTERVLPLHSINESTTGVFFHFIGETYWNFSSD